MRLYLTTLKYCNSTLFVHSLIIWITSNVARVLIDVHTLLPNMWFLQHSHNPLNSVHCNTLLKTAQTCQTQAVKVLMKSQYSSERVRLNHLNLLVGCFFTYVMKCANLKTESKTTFGFNKKNKPLGCTLSVLHKNERVRKQKNICR